MTDSRTQGAIVLFSLLLKNEKPYLRSDDYDLPICYSFVASLIHIQAHHRVGASWLCSFSDVKV